MAPAEALALLGQMQATAAYKATAAYNAKWLMIGLQIEADDMVKALTMGRYLVLDRLAGDVEVATVTTVDGLRFRPGRLFRRQRNR